MSYLMSYFTYLDASPLLSWLLAGLVALTLVFKLTGYWLTAQRSYTVIVGTILTSLGNQFAGVLCGAVLGSLMVSHGRLTDFTVLWVLSALTLPMAWTMTNFKLLGMIGTLATGIVLMVMVNYLGQVDHDLAPFVVVSLLFVLVIATFALNGLPGYRDRVVKPA